MVEIISDYDDTNNCLRPAGNAFIKDGEIVAPFQYCKNKYGEKIIINTIGFSGDKVFINNEVGEINKDNFDFIKKHGRIHTYNSCGDDFVIDYMNERFNLLNQSICLSEKLLQKGSYKRRKKTMKKIMFLLVA